MISKARNNTKSYAQRQRRYSLYSMRVAMLEV